jgi:glycosyltransferase involved in cell wall biosynthesis
MAIGNGQWAMDDETNRQSPIANRPKRPTGLLFESDNAQELADQMIWALEHPEEVKQIIAQAQVDVQKYAWKNVKQQLMKVYE